MNEKKPLARCGRCIVFQAAWLLSLLLIQSAEAQTILRGQIFGPDGKQLAAEVRFQLVSGDGSFQQFYFSDSNGRFIVTGLRPGREYTLIIDSDGITYEAARQVFNTETVTHQVLNIFLNPRKTEKKPPQPKKTVDVGSLGSEVPRAAASSYRAAMDQVDKGRLEEAVKLFQAAIGAYPSFFEAHNDLGVVFMRLNRMADAESALKKASGIKPLDHRPLLNLGVVLFRQGRYTSAIEALRKCLELEPDVAEAELRLGESYLELGSFNQAEKHLAAAVRGGDATRPLAMIKLAIVKIEKNDNAAAVGLLEAYLAEYPKAANRTEIEGILKQIRP